MKKENIKNKLRQINANWQLLAQESQISRNFEFDDFEKAMEFVNQVAGLAQKHDHHPDIKISYNKVSLNLTTHQASGLTDKDFELAQEIDKLN